MVYRSSMKMCVITNSKACQWDEPEQTAEHKEAGMFEGGPETGAWLQDNDDTERRFFQVWSSYVCSEANNNTTRKA